MEYIETLRKVQISHNRLGETYKELTEIILNLSGIQKEQNEKISELRGILDTQKEKIEKLQLKYQGNGLDKSVKPKSRSLLEYFSIKNIKEKNDTRSKFAVKGHMKIGAENKQKRKYCKKQKAGNRGGLMGVEKKLTNIEDLTK